MSSIVNSNTLCFSVLATSIATLIAASCCCNSSTLHHTHTFVSHAYSNAYHACFESMQLQ
jgi:hypothetical protein